MSLAGGVRSVATELRAKLSRRLADGTARHHSGDPGRRRSAAAAALRVASRQQLQQQGLTSRGPELSQPAELRILSVLAADDERLIELLTEKPEHRQYVTDHVDRFRVALRQVPPAQGEQRLLEIGIFNPEIRLLGTVWGYEVVACGIGCPPGSHTVTTTGDSLPAFSYRMDAVDVEREAMPYADACFDVVVCWELLEHMQRDPMQMIIEISRVLRRDGKLILTTPNVASAKAVRAVLRGQHPMMWPMYRIDGVAADRHTREFTPAEVQAALEAGGFALDSLLTVDVFDPPGRSEEMLRKALLGWRKHNGDDIMCVATKVDAPRERYPRWLYF